MQKPNLMWNSARGVWEKMGMANLLCGHWEPFLETWPTSGSMRNGLVFERPMPERPITDSESSSSRIALFDTPDTMPEMPNSGSNRKSQVAGLGNQALSLLRTPTAAEVDGGPVSPDVAKAKGQTLRLTGQVLDMLQTVLANDWKGRQATEKWQGGDLDSTIKMLPTPTVADTFTDNMKSSQQKEGSMHSVNLSQAVHMKWGKFAPAIERWENILGRKAPSATLPDGQKGQHRLSSRFTEWMMGLDDGWITGQGLNRKDEIKMCGNGVVPQQAKYALGILLDRIG